MSTARPPQTAKSDCPCARPTMSSTLVRQHFCRAHRRSRSGRGRTGRSLHGRPLPRCVRGRQGGRYAGSRAGASILAVVRPDRSSRDRRRVARTPGAPGPPLTVVMIRPRRASHMVPGEQPMVRDAPQNRPNYGRTHSDYGRMYPARRAPYRRERMGSTAARCTARNCVELRRTASYRTG